MVSLVSEEGARRPLEDGHASSGATEALVADDSPLKITRDGRAAPEQLEGTPDNLPGWMPQLADGSLKHVVVRKPSKGRKSDFRSWLKHAKEKVHSDYRYYQQRDNASLHSPSGSSSYAASKSSGSSIDDEHSAELELLYRQSLSETSGVPSSVAVCTHEAIPEDTESPVSATRTTTMLSPMAESPTLGLTATSSVLSTTTTPTPPVRGEGTETSSFMHEPASIESPQRQIRPQVSPGAAHFPPGLQFVRRVTSLATPSADGSHGEFIRLCKLDSGIQGEGQSGMTAASNRIEAAPVGSTASDCSGQNPADIVKELVDETDLSRTRWSSCYTDASPSTVSYVDGDNQDSPLSMNEAPEPQTLQQPAAATSTVSTCSVLITEDSLSNLQKEVQQEMAAPSLDEALFEVSSADELSEDSPSSTPEQTDTGENCSCADAGLASSVLGDVAVEEALDAEEEAAAVSQEEAMEAATDCATVVKAKVATQDEPIWPRLQGYLKANVAADAASASRPEDAEEKGATDLQPIWPRVREYLNANCCATEEASACSAAPSPLSFSFGQHTRVLGSEPQSCAPEHDTGAAAERPATCRSTASTAATVESEERPQSIWRRFELYPDTRFLLQGLLESELAGRLRAVVVLNGCMSMEAGQRPGPGWLPHTPAFDMAWHAAVIGQPLDSLPVLLLACRGLTVQLFEQASGDLRAHLRPLIHSLRTDRVIEILRGYSVSGSSMPSSDSPKAVGDQKDVVHFPIPAFDMAWHAASHGHPIDSLPVLLLACRGVAMQLLCQAPGELQAVLQPVLECLWSDRVTDFLRRCSAACSSEKEVDAPGRVCDQKTDKFLRSQSVPAFDIAWRAAALGHSVDSLPLLLLACRGVAMQLLCRAPGQLQAALQPLLDCLWSDRVTDFLRRCSAACNSGKEVDAPGRVCDQKTDKFLRSQSVPAFDIAWRAAALGHPVDSLPLLLLACRGLVAELPFEGSGAVVSDFVNRLWREMSIHLAAGCSAEDRQTDGHDEATESIKLLGWIVCEKAVLQTLARRLTSSFSAVEAVLQGTVSTGHKKSVRFWMQRGRALPANMYCRARMLCIHMLDLLSCFFAKDDCDYLKSRSGWSEVPMEPDWRDVLAGDSNSSYWTQACKLFNSTERSLQDAWQHRQHRSLCTSMLAMAFDSAVAGRSIQAVCLLVVLSHVCASRFLCETGWPMCLHFLRAIRQQLGSGSRRLPEASIGSADASASGVAADVVRMDDVIVARIEKGHKDICDPDISLKKPQLTDASPAANSTSTALKVTSDEARPERRPAVEFETSTTSRQSFSDCALRTEGEVFTCMQEVVRVPLCVRPSEFALLRFVRGLCPNGPSVPIQVTYESIEFCILATMVFLPVVFSWAFHVPEST
eukprot:TRINITY_DN9833_c0_g1_i4.p1 TRINITY_DN9833_c0_g1~~TRINITY_DN9833_c0_g1_i4.p1  ORF type:complete len:1403 (+),score=182.30 TRINITY_DN9833_c0_g1_i4:58-4209(+)